MPGILKKAAFGANDLDDMVIIVVDDLQPMIPYQNALELSHKLLAMCKKAAMRDRVPATFWRDVDTEDLNDCPEPHRGFRRSELSATAKTWQVWANGSLVDLQFDDQAREFSYEDGVKLHQMIRRASQRAKAWAGDTNQISRMIGVLTDGEENYRLGLQ